MLAGRVSIFRAVEERYRQHGEDISFASLIAEFPSARDDDGLADLIEADGRARIVHGLKVDLERYVGIFPDLKQRTVPVDAAIDVCLRSMSSSNSKAGVDALIHVYPDLKEAILEAAELADALHSTSGIVTAMDRRSPVNLPAEFGSTGLAGVARYELRRVLGSGGWGNVFLALDRQLSEPNHEALVAIKLLAGGDRTPWARQRLIDEATKARRIEDPHVVRVLDRGVSGEDEDFIVYEYIAGGDLGYWLESHPQLSCREAAGLMAMIARGVHAAHAAGLVHCDLKPGNVLMTHEGRPKVADFGIAVRSEDQANSRHGSVDGRRMGNIAFISPEQYRGEDGSITTASDIYALGGVFYFLLTRTLPNGESPEAIARNHDSVNGRVVPPSLRDAGLKADHDLELICSRAMAIKPGERYSSAAAMADDLEAWLAHVPIHWTRPSPARRMSLLIKRNPALVGAVIVALIVGLIGGFIAVRFSGGPSVLPSRGPLVEYRPD